MDCDSQGTISPTDQYTTPVPDHHCIPVVGLIGGVGSGKSALARRVTQSLSDSAPFRVAAIDVDRLGHEVLREPTAKQQIRQRFGTDVFDDHGEIHRSALGRQVFGTEPHHRKNRHDLESIVHPLIREKFSRTIHTMRDSSQTDAILLDAAVLLEAGWDDICDAIVFVDVPENLRQQRVADRGWDATMLAAREASQLSLDQKRAAANHIIDNSGSLEDAAAQLQRYLAGLVHNHHQ